jgi:hypothetical protein
LLFEHDSLWTAYLTRLGAVWRAGLDSAAASEEEHQHGRGYDETTIAHYAQHSIPFRKSFSPDTVPSATAAPAVWIVDIERLRRMIAKCAWRYSTQPEVRAMKSAPTSPNADVSARACSCKAVQNARISPGQ